MDKFFFFFLFGLKESYTLDPSMENDNDEHGALFSIVILTLITLVVLFKDRVCTLPFNMTPIYSFC